MSSDLPWFDELSAEDRSWVGLIVQAGIEGSSTGTASTRSRPRSGSPLAAAVFGAAPRELTGVDHAAADRRAGAADASRVVEANARRDRSTPTTPPSVHEAVLRYSREVAFATAEVYARAAEVARRLGRPARGARRRRGAPRRGRRGGAVPGQRTGLGCTRRRRRRAGRGASAPRRETDVFDDDPPRRPAPAGMDALCAVQGDRLVVVLGGVRDAAQGRRRGSSTTSAPGPSSSGPVDRRPRARPRLGPGRRRGPPGAAGWPEAPRPVRSDDLLPERALAGDGHARRQLVDDGLPAAVRRPRHPAGDPGGVLRARVARSRRPVAPCSCTPTPCATGCGRSPTSPGCRPPTPATPSPCGSPSPWAASPVAPRHLCRNPTKTAGEFRRV